MVGPRQLSHQWCDFLSSLISLVELPHSKEVRACVAPDPGIATRKSIGEIVYDPVSPLGGGNLLADVLAERPVETHELAVHRLIRTPSCRLDEFEDFRESRFVRDES